MSLYHVVPASVRHIKPLAETLRPAACETLARFGLDARRGLLTTFRASRYRRTAIIQGRPVAMWGTHGGMLSDHAELWAAFTTEAVRFPLAIVRGARKELAALTEGGIWLYAKVSKDDEKALLFAETVGFRVSSDLIAPEGMLGMAFGVR